MQFSSAQVAAQLFIRRCERAPLFDCAVSGLPASLSSQEPDITCSQRTGVDTLVGRATFPRPHQTYVRALMDVIRVRIRNPVGRFSLRAWRRGSDNRLTAP